MTIAQAHREFKLFYDKIDSESLPDLLPQEIDVLLHDAEVRVVKSYLVQEENQFINDKLSSLFKSQELTLTNNEVSLPLDYLGYRRSKVKVSNSRVTTPVYTNNYMCPQGKLNTVLSDPFNKSIISYPVIYLEDNKIKVDTNNNTFNTHNILLTYIKLPVRVDKLNGVNSILSESLQKEAIQLAVTIGLDIVESQRIQSNASLLPTTK